MPQGPTVTSNVSQLLYTLWNIQL